MNRRRLRGILLALSITAVPARAEKCVQIYYDGIPAEKGQYVFGKVHALFLQNLLGHFPEYQVRTTPIERYQRVGGGNALDRCSASFYIGTYYNNPGVPPEFIEDYVFAKKPVVWMGYNIWNIGAESLRHLWEVKFLKLSLLDMNRLDERKQPTFFRYFDYKGERFIKYGEFDAKVAKRFNASWEISLFELTDTDAKEFVVSWARHSASKKRLPDDYTTDDKLPYILRNSNHWYIGDSPFSFMHEEDRYLIFADLLFDILDEKPRHSGKKPALFRLEDVHPRIPLWQLYKVTNRMNDLGIPFSISLIPKFSDPYFQKSESEEEADVPLTKRPLFMEFLEYAMKRNVSFIYHGVSHQYEKAHNPWNGLTGDDFEFWDRPKNRPVPMDSTRWVVERLEDGMTLLSKAKVKPVAWLTPHYQASPLDYNIFSQLFTWNVGRIIYFPHTMRQKTRLPGELTIDKAGATANGKRLKYLADLDVKYDERLQPTGQFFPYEIYGDLYQQRIIPENVGNVQPYMNEQVYLTQSIEDLVRIVRRNRVLRDTWASFFLHPFRLAEATEEGVGKYPGDTSGVEKLITAVKDAGYEFVNLEKWVQTRAQVKNRPLPVEED